MNKVRNSILVAAVIAGAVGIAGAQGVPPGRDVANPALGAGQEGPGHTSAGETGTPHNHGEATGWPASKSRRATPSKKLMRPSDRGQESSLHTPQGETGTPHAHAGAVAKGTASMGASGPAINTMDAANPAFGRGQEGLQGTPQGETGTPHTHLR